jgi:hypothetical protein
LIEFRFRPWRTFKAIHEKRNVRRFIEDAANESEDAFKSGMRSRKSGRVYRIRGRSHKASAPGEYPARETGALFRSIRTRISNRGFAIGTTKDYAIYLREGTRKMARRRMSDDALQEGLPIARRRMKAWARFDR